MSSIVETMMGELGGGTLQQLGASLGATPDQTKSMMGAALPALISGLAQNTAKPEGAAALAGALDRDHGPNLMDQLGPIAGQLLGGGGGSGGGGGGLGAALGGMLGGGGGGGGGGGLSGMLGGMLGNAGGSSGGAGGLAALLPAAMAMMNGGGDQAAMPKALNGAGILSHVFGGNQQQVVANAAQASGVDSGMMTKFLVMVAPMVMSALGTMKQKNHLDANGLAGMLKQEQTQLGGAPAEGGFGAGDLMKVGSAIASSGLLGKLFR
ncbi:MAG: DUF937 domain-containing protein [Myxococcales bacterium]|nr:DUF937 domain-containing protein [Myxococcales bacterium]